MKLVYFLMFVLAAALGVNLYRHRDLLSSIQLPTLLQIKEGAKKEVGDSKDVSELVKHSSQYLLMVNGDEAKGSASVINWKGNALIVTNIHVLSGNANPHFQLLNGQQLSPDILGVPADRDILIASQHQVTGGLEASTAVASDVTIGDEVVVLGNSLGSNVATEVRGKILGIGPDLIETDAKFVPGNSGSPIIHVKTGKVIAIATFAIVRKLDAISRDSQFNKVRRFGYRFDTVAGWQFVTAKNFATESGLITEIKQRTSDLLAMDVDILKHGYVKASHCSNDGWVRGAVNSFCVAGPRYGLGAMKFEQALKNLRDRSDDDIRLAQQTKIIPYHQKELAQEIHSREILNRFMDKVPWERVVFEQ